MVRMLGAVVAGAALALAGCQAGEGTDKAAGESAAVGNTERGQITLATFNEDGSLNQPKNWRQWVYIGTPLTPQQLNGMNTAFPEFHAVYMDPASYDHYKKTGTFQDGTQLVKELTTVRGHGNGDVKSEPEAGDKSRVRIGNLTFDLEGKDPANGSTTEVSGQGYFMGEYSGLEIAIKDSKRYADEPGFWAYYTWGHNPFPYEKTASKFPAEACNACHDANAEDDWVFTQFYPVLRAAKNAAEGSAEANAS